MVLIVFTLLLSTFVTFVATAVAKNVLQLHHGTVHCCCLAVMLLADFGLSLSSLLLAAN